MPKKKAAKSGAAGGSRKSRDVLVVASKVKAYIRGKNMNTSADAIDTISEKVYCLLDCATERTKANGRKTLKAQDI